MLDQRGPVRSRTPSRSIGRCRSSLFPSIDGSDSVVFSRTGVVAGIVSQQSAGRRLSQAGFADDERVVFSACATEKFKTDNEADDADARACEHAAGSYVPGFGEEACSVSLVVSRGWMYAYMCR